MPGMGATSRIFSRLRWPEGFDVVPMEWFVPPDGSMTLSDYAAALAERYAVEPGSILAGMSFGGVMINEMAALTSPERLIFISTVKSGREFPPYFRPTRSLGLWRLLPFKLIVRPGDLMPLAPTKRLRKRLALYRDYMGIDDVRYFRWATRSILHWKGEVPQLPYVHIHGTADRIFPYRYLRGRLRPVEGAGHLALMTHPRRVSALIADFLAE